jgi:hypothetical protein
MPATSSYRADTGSRREAGLQLSLRVSDANPDHHLWNNNGTWFVHYTVCEPGFSGERRRHSLRTADRREARRRRDRLFKELELVSPSHAQS